MLDIYKAFDKIWHDGVIFKLERNGMSGELLNILIDFLSNMNQRVLFNGEVSAWISVNAGVSQGSILEPLLFLIYINDLSNNLLSNVKLFADNTSLFSVTHDVNLPAKKLNDDLRQISNLAFQWKTSFNHLGISQTFRNYRRL